MNQHSTRNPSFFSFLLFYAFFTGVLYINFATSSETNAKEFYQIAQSSEDEEEGEEDDEDC